MGTRGRAWMLLLGLGPPGCRAIVFECDRDTQCDVRGRLGTCEPDHHCSFPDEHCDSGQRYGELAPEGIASVCVPVDGEEITAALVNESTGPLTEDSETTGAEASSDDSSGSSGIEGADTSEPPPLYGCEISFFEPFSFEADVWVPRIKGNANVVAEDGEAVFLLGGGADVSAALFLEREVLLDNGWAQVLVNEIEGPALPIVGAVGLEDDACQYTVRTDSGLVVANVRDRDSDENIVVGSTPLPGLPLRMRIGRLAEGTILFEWSTPGSQWQVLHAEPVPQCETGTPWVTPFLGALAHDLEGIGRRTFEEFILCTPE